MERWYRFLGVRPGETKTVWLFFLHNFLLGLGTVLVYVTANVLLLERQPARNLPLAYCVGALAMMAVGRAYAYYEHRRQLQHTAVRALLAVVVLTVLLGLLLLLGPGVPAAVAIMTGYRLIYLLTNLEFWGMSAVVFNVRQGRRLFSVISSGDMPAKALGAILTVFVHAHTDLFFLLLTAFGAYLLALLVQRRTFRLQPQLMDARPELRHPQPPALLRQVAGGRPLVLSMGLSLAAIAVVAAGVEYLFFLNVKQEMQDQATVLRYVGGTLALTYLLATLFKLLLSRHGFDRLGVRRTLAALPLAALAGILLFGGLLAAGVGPRGQMLYFCGLYLGLEVLRRALFEPAFLVLFQPLAPPERLQGHTLAKGFYEPLGLGLGGLLLLGLPAAEATPALHQWVPLGWMSLFLLGALVLLQRTYRHYLDELKGALGLRFGQNSTAALPGQTPVVAGATGPKPAHPDDVLAALEHLHKAGLATLREHSGTLLSHSDSRVRNRMLTLLGDQADPALLRRLALDDPDSALREAASRLASRYPEATDLLRHQDLAVRKGAIRGRLEQNPADAPARESLAAVAAAAGTDYRLAALELISFLSPEQQVQLVTAAFHSAEPVLIPAAVRAAGETPSSPMIGQLIQLLTIKLMRQPATDSLVRLGGAALPQLQAILTDETDERLLRSLTQVCARLPTPASRQLLVSMVQGTNLCARTAALRALSNFASVPADAPRFQRLVEQEMRLAQHLLHGMVEANAELRTALRYELRRVQQRLFGLLMQIYDRQPLVDAQRGVTHAARERQANALEILDNLIPRPLYQGLQALLDVGRLSEKVQTLDSLLGPAMQPEPIQTTIVRRGPAAFAAWTISVALRQWHPTPSTVAYLYPHLQSFQLLVQESARALLRQLPLQRPAAYDSLITLYPAVTASAVPDHATSRVSFLERVLLLKSTTLFGETPENVLSTIVPIMKEVAFEQNQEIFAKGTLGTSLFIICEGEVGVFNGPQQLTVFRRGDFFGELALLDAEPRSASAVALSPVVAFRLDQDDFYDVVEECAEVVRNIMRVLCTRLRQQNEKTQQAVAHST